MMRPVRPFLLCLAFSVLLVPLALGCSTDEPSADPASTSTTAAPPADASGASPDAAGAPAGGPKVTQPRQSCAADTLGAAAAASFNAPALIDVVCEQANAVATLNNGPNGETVLYFGLENGVWVLAGSAALDAADASVPGGFSATAVPSWQRARQARIERASTGGSSTEGNQPQGCKKDGDFWICPTTTVAAGSDDPNAPLTPQSGFCKYNYNDPRCVADPGFAP